MNEEKLLKDVKNLENEINEMLEEKGMNIAVNDRDDFIFVELYVIEEEHKNMEMYSLDRQFAFTKDGSMYDILKFLKLLKKILENMKGGE